MKSPFEHHRLDYIPTLKYVEETLKDANVLSSELLKLIDFKNGYFFTLLPEDVHTENIYKFNVGGILPSDLNTNLEKGITHSRTQTIREYLSNTIINELKTKKLQCIFDDVIRNKNDTTDLFNICGLSYNDEVYYLTQTHTASHELINKCLVNSIGFWHSLFLLTSYNIKIAPDRKLTLQQIGSICLHTQLIAVSAYDSEGYIFWEKKNSEIFRE